MSEAVAPSSRPRQPPQPLGYHQGYVLQWNALSGTNLIRIAGADIPDVPSLMGGEVGLIRPGDSVGLLRFQNTYAVLGRIESAGIEQRALGVHFDQDVGDAAPSTSTFTDKGGPQVAVHIGSTRRCRVSLSCETEVSGTIMWMGFQVNGASSIPAVEWRSLAVGGADVYFEGSREVILTEDDGLNEGLNVFTCMYRIGSNGDPIPIVAERQLVVQPF
jgi:hypothetical protein